MKELVNWQIHLKKKSSRMRNREGKKIEEYDGEVEPQKRK